MRFVAARNFTKTKSGRTISKIVIHTMEAKETGTTAESVANYFRTTTRKASAHLCIDNNSIVRCVADKDIAWAAPGANHDGLQYELAGMAGQTHAQWADAYSKAVLDRTARQAAADATQYGIPIRKLSSSQLKAGWSGFTGHADVRKAFKRSTHWDPGPNFPWTTFLALVSHYTGAGATTVVTRNSPADWIVLRKGMRGDSVEFLQQKAISRWGSKIRVDGDFGPATEAFVKNFQRYKHLSVDGVVGPNTWLALMEQTR